MEKTYLALVRGHAPEERLIDYAVRKGEQRGPDVPRQSAQTSIRRLGTWERYSLVEARPHTGRLHQIRRHLSHIAHPIIGDTSYGKSNHNRLFNEVYECSRLLLAATQLTLDHPVTGERLELRAGLDRDFTRIVRLFEQPEFAAPRSSPGMRGGSDIR